MDSPRTLAEAFVERWNPKDGDGLGALSDDDARFVNVVGLFWRSRKAIARNHQIAFDSFFKDARTQIRRIEEHRLGDNVVAVHVHWRAEGDAMAGRRGVLLLVRRRAPAGWSIAVAQNTDLLPGHVTRPASGQTD